MSTFRRAVAIPGIALLLLIWGGSNPASSPSQPSDGTEGLTIPSSHPRLWWNADRLARARAWYRSHQVQPASDDTAGFAFVCVVAGEAEACEKAITLAMNQQCRNAACNSANPEVGVASDDARWEGENVILVYDWLYERLTPVQRATLIGRWNTYFHNIRQHTWGGPEQVQSNFNWGYMRNEIDWGIATWGENPDAPVNLQHGLRVRWQDNAVPHFRAEGRGGVMQEGSAYGSALGQYSVVPFLSAQLLGRDVYRETNFFREAVFYVLYSTLPALTHNRNNDQSFPEVFPFADDERFFDGGMPARINYGTFMTTMADYWRETPVGAYARNWLNFVKPVTPAHVAAVDRGGAAAPYDALPLDYYAPGPQFAYVRNQWGPNATVLSLQLGVTTDEGHQHTDVGSWQLWRKGWWLSRETTGYSQDITGVGGAAVDAGTASAHNVLFVNGQGPAAGRRVGQAIVKRLESQPAYFYANADLTPAYRSTHPVLDNAAVVHVEREYIFIRPFETVVTFDRLESVSSSQPKLFITHFESAPTVDEERRQIVYAQGGQTLRMTTVLPAGVRYRPIVNEGGRIGQHRVELEASGEPQTYFLNVIQAGDDREAAVSAAVTDSGAEFELRVTHPTRGTVLLTFQKGVSSSGGTITIGGVRTALASTVQKLTVTDQGVTWTQP